MEVVLWAVDLVIINYFLKFYIIKTLIDIAES